MASARMKLVPRVPGGWESFEISPWWTFTWAGDSGNFAAQADVLLELLSTRYRRTADRARVIEALTASGGDYPAAARWLNTEGHLRSVS